MSNAKSITDSESQMIQVITDLLQHQIEKRLVSATKQNAVYEIEIKGTYKTPIATNDVVITRPFQIGPDGNYIKVPSEQQRYSYDEQMSKETFIRELLKMCREQHLLLLDVVRPLKVRVYKVCNSVNEYYALQKLDHDMFDMNVFVESRPDGIYVAYDTSNRKKSTKQPPFYFIVRDGVRTLVDIDEHGICTFEDNITAQAIVARATLNFGNTYCIRAATLS